MELPCRSDFDCEYRMEDLVRQASSGRLVIIHGYGVVKIRSLVLLEIPQSTFSSAKDREGRVKLAVRRATSKVHVGRPTYL